MAKDPPPDQRRSKELGVDAVAKKELRKLRRAGAKGASTERDAFEKRAEPQLDDERPGAEQRADQLDSGSAQTRKSMAVTGQVAHATEDRPVISPLGLSVRQAPTPISSVVERSSTPAHPLPAPEQIVEVARRRIRSQGRHYAFSSRCKSPHPRLLGNSAPDQSPVPGTHDQYKDVFLCLDILYEAGLAVPLVEIEVEGAPRALWYPLAAELPDFSRGRRRCFNVVAIERLAAMPQKQRRARIAKVLGAARPGDLLCGHFLDDDHQLYGLVWLLIDSQVETARSIEATSVTDGGAGLARYALDHFLWAESLQVLRAMRSRDDDDDAGDLAAPPKVFS